MTTALLAGAAVGLPMWLAIIASVLGGGLYGYLNDTLLWRPLRKRGAGLVPMMIVSIGFALTMRYGPSSGGATSGTVAQRAGRLPGASTCQLVMLRR